jgi:acetyl esterase/lipase
VSTQAFASCDHTEIIVPTTHDGDYNVKVLVHTPKVAVANHHHDTSLQSLVGQAARPCIMYAHGGGVIGGTADLYSRFLAHMALDCGVVVFNVDFRPAPETR